MVRVSIIDCHDDEPLAIVDIGMALATFGMEIYIF